MNTSPDATEWLFSYGTLQLEAVQLATFGRRLAGEVDTLPEYAQTLVAIDDPVVVATSGQTHHPIVRWSGNAADAVAGTVFAVTRSEIENADRYEVAAYRRIPVLLRSGRRAWVYVDARYTTGAATGT